jgi:hypothetical protein
MPTKKPATKAGKARKTHKVMEEYKEGTLHSGKGGKKVTSRKQAIAIAMSESGQSKNKKSGKKTAKSKAKTSKKGK